MTDAAVPRLSPLRPASRRWSRGRRAAGAALAAAAALVLSACGDLRAGAAAVVGDQRITDDQLQTLVDEALAAPGVREGLPASNFRGDLGAYRRTVLNGQVERLLAEAGAQRLGLPVDDARVEARYRFIQEQAGGPERFATELASRLAFTPSLYREYLRTETIEAEIGYERGGVERPDEAQLQALYREYLPTAIKATLSLIQVPDLATADRLAAQLQTDPGAFAQLAARYSGGDSQTSPTPQEIELSRLPQDLAARVERAERNEVFAYRLSNGSTETFFVVRVGRVTRPTFEAARPALEAQSLQQAATEGKRYLSEVARDVGVDVNPRYGTFKPEDLTITDFVNPVIKVTPSPTQPAPLPADPGAGTPAPTPSPSG